MVVKSLRRPGIVLLTLLACASLSACDSGAGAASDGAAAGPSGGFRRIVRTGAVDVRAAYDLAGLAIPEAEIHALLPRDAIPALTDPKRESALAARWLPDDARVIVAVGGGETLGVPLRILDWHEVVNLTLGGSPLAVTYCPLCDSAVVCSRRVTRAGPEGAPRQRVLEFGVSGALYNSNVLLYDREDRGLWSQLAMRAVSGPLVGTELEVLPVTVTTFGAFKQAELSAGRTPMIVSRETGHDRDYDRSPYAEYFTSESLAVPVARVGDALARKTLGMGIALDEAAWFVPVSVIGGSFTLTTPAGDVRLASTEAGVQVVAAPASVRTAQTLYYSWSAFYPRATVVTTREAGGLPAGRRRP